jgi:microcystin-dependent protein
MTLYKWSQTASADANADSTVNWAEGQSPSSVNDSARAMMAATAKYRDDIAGAIVTGGTSTAYTVSSYEVFDTLARLNGQMIAFTPHLTNGAVVTLNVDGLGAKPLRSAPGVELLPGTLIQGTPYIALYNHASAAFYLHCFFGNPYNVPLAAGLDYWAATTPNSAFAFPAGQPISRTTYAALFSLIGTTYGAGDGSTTFNLPDKTGRVSVMKEVSATRLTTAGGGVDGATLGAANSGNNQNVALVTANLPAYTPAGNITNGAITVNVNGSVVRTGTQWSAPGTGNFAQFNATATASQAPSTFIGAPQGGTSAAFKIVQPTIVCNYIMRVT